MYLGLNAAVIKISDEAGKAELFCNYFGGIAKTDELNFAFKNDMPSFD